MDEDTKRYLSSNVWTIVIYDKGSSHCQICHFCVVIICMHAMHVKHKLYKRFVF